MDRQVQQQHDNSFVIGLLTGAFVGAGLALWLTPGSAAEVRGRVTGSARRFGEELARKSDGVRDRLAETVERGAREVERFATASKSDAPV